MNSFKYKVLKTDNITFTGKLITNGHFLIYSDNIILTDKTLQSLLKQKTPFIWQAGDLDTNPDNQKLEYINNFFKDYTCGKKLVLTNLTFQGDYILKGDNFLVFINKDYKNIIDNFELQLMEKHIDYQSSFQYKPLTICKYPLTKTEYSGEIIGILMPLTDYDNSFEKAYKEILELGKILCKE